MMLCGTCSADCKHRAPGECPEEENITKKLLRYVERGGTASIGLRQPHFSPFGDINVSGKNFIPKNITPKNTNSYVRTTSLTKSNYF